MKTEHNDTRFLPFMKVTNSMVFLYLIKHLNKPLIFYGQSEKSAPKPTLLRSLRVECASSNKL